MRALEEAVRESFAEVEQAKQELQRAAMENRRLAEQVQMQWLQLQTLLWTVQSRSSMR